MYDETKDTNEVAKVGDTESEAQAVRGNFHAPLDGIKEARLLFASGASNVTITTTPDNTELYTAHFRGQVPSVRVQNGIISVHYRHHFPLDWLLDPHDTVARVALNTTIPWEIEFRDGLSKLRADLSQLQLRAVDMGSVSTAQLTLPVPATVANIYVSGSASDLILRRPANVAVRLHISGAASHLQLDGEYVGATSGNLRWQSQQFQESPNRYEVDIAGSVSNLVIESL